MNVPTTIAELKEKLPASLREASWLRPPYPWVGIELRSDAVVVTHVAKRKGALGLAGHSKSLLAEGVFTPGLDQRVVAQPSALAEAVSDALSRAGAENAGRVSLAIPDTMARVLLVDLAELPSSPAQAEQMIRFRIRKSLPFRPEDARLAWHSLGAFEDGRAHVLVVVTPERIIQEVEAPLVAAGLRVGLVELASFDLLNALRLSGQLVSAREGDLAILNATPNYFGVMILRGERLIFYRAKGYHLHEGYRGRESLRVVGRELRSTISYYEEHLLGEGIREVLVRVSGIDPEGFVETVLEAGCGEAAYPELGSLLPELRELDLETTSDLMPSLGLALRRLP